MSISRPERRSGLGSWARMKVSSILLLPSACSGLVSLNAVSGGEGASAELWKKVDGCPRDTRNQS